MKASTRRRQNSEEQSRRRTKRQQFESASQRSLQHFLALRAEGDANSQLPQPLAHRVRRHSKDAGDRQHRAHHAQHAQRHRRHARGKQRAVPSIVRSTSAMLNGSPASRSRSCAPDGCGQLLRIAFRAHNHREQCPCMTRRRLQEWEKHRRLWIFGQARIFSVFHDAHHLDARSIPHLVISADAPWLPSQRFCAANSRFTTATRGAFLSSCHVRDLPASKAVPAASKYSGDMLYVIGFGSGIRRRQIVVSSRKTCVLFAPHIQWRIDLPIPPTLRRESLSRASIMRFCIAGTWSPL